MDTTTLILLALLAVLLVAYTMRRRSRLQNDDYVPVVTGNANHVNRDGGDD